MNDTLGHNYFSWDNIDEIAEFDSHLRFAEELIGKYSRNGSVKNDLKQRLSYIQEKRKDDQLNVSVIGEFSTGKSTFINALTRHELLAACSLQGTTVASTVIEYSPETSMEVMYRDRSTKKFRYGSVKELAEAVEKYTADPEEGKNIKLVNICLPSDNLRSGFRIIDTPGTNSTDLWHEEVTRTAISELSDVSIILIDANKVLPESFCSFVRNNLEDILPQCVFVVTKLDLVNERERPRVLEYTRVKLRQTFGISDPLVLPYVSTAVLKDAAGGSPDPALAELTAQCYESEREIFRYTGKYRAVTQAKKLISLIDDMYASITYQIDHIAADNERELEMLERSKRADLSEFVSSQKSIRTAEFNKNIASKKQAILDRINSDVNDAGPMMLTRARNREDAEAFHEFVSRGLSLSCAGTAQEMINHAESGYPEFVKEFERQMDKFRSEFKSKFENMRLLSVDLSKTIHTPASPERVAAANFSAAGAISEKQASRNSNIGCVMFIIGAVIGGASVAENGFFSIAIGAVIMGALLSWIGTLIYNKLSSGGREKAIEKLRTPIYQYFSESGDLIRRNVEGYIQDLSDAISTEIDRYLATYRSEVDRQISIEREKKSTIESRLRTLRSDKTDIENRQSRLRSVSRRLGESL